MIEDERVLDDEGVIEDELRVDETRGVAEVDGSLGLLEGALGEMAGGGDTTPTALFSGH